MGDATDRDGRKGEKSSRERVPWRTRTRFLVLQPLSQIVKKENLALYSNWKVVSERLGSL